MREIGHFCQTRGVFALIPPEPSRPLSSCHSNHSSSPKTGLPPQKKLGASKQVCPLLQRGGRGGLSPVIALHLQSAPRGSQLNPRAPAASWAPQPRLGWAGGGAQRERGICPRSSSQLLGPPRGGSSIAGRMGVRGWWLCPSPRGWCRDTTPHAPGLGAQTAPPQPLYSPEHPRRAAKRNKYGTGGPGMPCSPETPTSPLGPWKGMGRRGVRARVTHPGGLGPLP